MKIQDLITLKKLNNTGYMNGLKRDYQKKKGYYWEIPSHSQNESILLNNYEKDCVIAYINNKYLLAFLIKIQGKDNFKGFVYLKEFLNNILDINYTIEMIYIRKNILKAFNEDEGNLKIINAKEYQRFKKLIILEGLEN